MFNWLRHAFGGGSHTEAPPIPARSPVKHTASAPAPKPAPEKRVDTPTGENVQDRFILRKQCSHGFPLAPSCMTFDNFRKLLFIGTATGELRVYGRPGVEMSQLHDEVTRVVQILPLETEASVITLCSDNILYKWSMLDKQGNPQLQVQRVYQFPGGLAKAITVMALCPSGECIFVGTLGGVTYPLDISFDGMSPEVLSWARARHILGYEGEEVPGEVKALEINPVMPQQLLIGYEHGYLELWDSLKWLPLHIFPAVEGVGDFTAASWHPNGLSFCTGHVDGTVTFYDCTDINHPSVETKKHYEGDQFQEIHHVLWPGDNLLVFSGGIPVDMIDGDNVTVVDGHEVITLQLTSGVRAMHVLDVAQSDMDSGMVDAAGSAEPLSTTMRKVLLLLLEHEALFIELRLPDLPQLKPPYLYSVHNSPVKAVDIYNNVQSDVWTLLQTTGALQNNSFYRASNKVWPIDGGTLLIKETTTYDLLITGHEDGSVKFWDIRSVSMSPMLTIRSSEYFEQLEDIRSPSPTPQQLIRSIGLWDPRCDDDRIIVTCVRLVGSELLVGFQGGQCLVFKPNKQSATCSVSVVDAPLMSAEDQMKTARRKWEGPIMLKSDQLECPPGYQPELLIQLMPPSQVTAMASAPELNLMAIGSNYGVALIDTLQNKLIMVHSTFDASMPEANYHRLQSIRKSFRQSMRRFNLSRSMRASQSVSRPVRPGQERSRSFRGIGSAAGAMMTSEPTLKRDGVRILNFTPPICLTGTQTHYSMWVGTNLGAVLPYNIEMPNPNQRHDKPVVAHLVVKDYSKRKNQGVLFIGVLDGCHLLEWNERGNVGSRGQYLVVCTEDQVKVDALQSGKRRYKARFKHNVHMDTEYRLMSANFIKVGGMASVMCLDSLGYVHILSLPDLKPIYKRFCVDPTDVAGQRSLVSTTLGLIMYLRSPSEFGRYSIGEETSLDIQFSIPAKRKPITMKQNATMSPEVTKPVITKDDATKQQNDVTKQQDDAANKQDDATNKQDDATNKQDDATNKQDDATNKQQDDATSKQQDDATSKQQDDATNKQDDATNKQQDDATNKQDAAISKQDDATNKQDDATNKQDDATNKQDDATNKQDDATSKQDDATSKQDDATSKQDDATSKQDDATSKQDDATSKQDDATSKQDDATSKQDDATSKQEVAVQSIATQQPVAASDAAAKQAQVEEGSGDTTQDEQKDRRSEEKDVAGIADKRISSEVTSPPLLSPQSVTSQDVTFEERAL